MDEIQGNNIARNFSSEYFNYTINFIISKEFPALISQIFRLFYVTLTKTSNLQKNTTFPSSHFHTKITDKNP